MIRMMSRERVNNHPRFSIRTGDSDAFEIRDLYLSGNIEWWYNNEYPYYSTIIFCTRERSRTHLVDDVNNFYHTSMIEEET